MLNKFALKCNKCALNVENDIEKRKNNLRMKNDANVKPVSESRYFFLYITNILIIKLENE